MRYIKASELINEVMLSMKSYFESGIVDESILYPEIQLVLGLMGVKILPKRKTVFNLKSKTTKLPTDFHSAIFMAACDWEVTPLYSNPTVVTYEKRAEELPICHSECDYCHDEHGRYQIIQRIDQAVIKHRMQRILSMNTKSTNSDLCFNPKVKSQWDISIENNILYTQVDNGTIYLEYRGLLEEDGELLIPDYSEIRNWINWHLKHHILQTIWYNMEGDAFQRYQDAKRELNIAKANGMAFSKIHAFEDYKDLKKLLSKQFTNYASY